MNWKMMDDLEEESKRRGIPIIGKEKGEWLLQKVKEHQPKTILELGTANGYSGIILGSEGGELITIDINIKIVEEAIINYSKFSINGKIITGDGVEVVKSLSTDYFDFIFIDFYKKGYLKILDDCFRLLKKNGVMIADNISAEGCQDFKEAILNNSKLKTKIIKIKDGLSYSVKID